MAEALRLYGFEHSVYTWIVRLVMAVLEVEPAYVEVNPFADPRDAVLAGVTPLNRVPVLVAGDMRLTETAAICRYLDAQAGQPLSPDDPRGLARMAQVIGLVDADVYPICVRQVFSQGCYRLQVLGEAGDTRIVRAGLEAALPVLSVLEEIAAEGVQLSGEVLSLADLHLAPMLSYFVRLPEGREVLRGYPALDAWWRAIAELEALRRTDPLPDLPEIA